jgi:hypothetical protein
VNVQVLADPAGRLVWASPALPGSTHDLTAARTLGLVDALTNADAMTFADKGYQGAGDPIRTRFKRHRHRRQLSRNQKSVNRSHVKIRAFGERANATLKTWKSWPSSTAAHAAPPRSCRPSSSCTASNRPATQDEKGWLWMRRHDRSRPGRLSWSDPA